MTANHNYIQYITTEHIYVYRALQKQVLYESALGIYMYATFLVILGLQGEYVGYTSKKTLTPWINNFMKCVSY